MDDQLFIFIFTSRPSHIFQRHHSYSPLSIRTGKHCYFQPYFHLRFSTRVLLSRHVSYIHIITNVLNWSSSRPHEAYRLLRHLHWRHSRRPYQDGYVLNIIFIPFPFSFFRVFSPSLSGSGLMMIDLELFDDITPKCVSFCGREWEGRGEGERGGTESWSLFRFGIVGQQKTLGNYVQASTGMFPFFFSKSYQWMERASSISWLLEF